MDLRYARLDEYDTFALMHSNMFGHATTSMPKEQYLDFIEGCNVFFLIDEEGEILGFTIILINLQDEAIIRDIFVKEKNRGIGSKFLKLIEEEILIPNGAKNSTAHVFTEEPENFWLRNGYRYVAEGTFQKAF